MIYENYFELSKRPFSIAPNPHFLFAQGQYREAMAALEYAMVHRGGFVLLTGEVGTGKTTLCKHLLQHVPQDTELALILHPQLDRLQLLQLICREFDVQVNQDATELQLIDSLTEFLLSVYANGGYSVLIIDEAQHLDFEVLELIRLLTNLETHEDKLLQIILLGQPELKSRLERHELRQLNQRFTARYHLKPLSASQVAAYVGYRLSIAGSARPLFSKWALQRLSKLSGGIPRLINVIADRSLMGAYAEESSYVTARIVKKAAKEVLSEAKFSSSLGQKVFRPSIALPVAFLLLVMIFGGVLYKQVSVFSLQNLAGVFINQQKPECVGCWQGRLPSRLIGPSDWIKDGDGWAVYQRLESTPDTVYVELEWPFVFSQNIVIEAGETHEAVAWTRQSLSSLQGLLSVDEGWEVIRPQGDSNLRAGFYDPLLEEQVRQFQADYALRVDGVIGSQTLMALSRAVRSNATAGNE